MKLPSILLACALMSFSPCFAQSDVSGLDKLGPHESGGRGCVSCHPPHTAIAGDGTPAHQDLWGRDLGPLYTTSVLAGEPGAPDVTIPAEWTSEQGLETGIMLCLSCHDGNIASGGMMRSQAYQFMVPGFSSEYGSHLIPIAPGYKRIGPIQNYYLDHPVGPAATLGAVGVANRLVLTTCGESATPCLQPKTSDIAYMSFYQNYGAFNITQKNPSAGFYSGGRASGVAIPAGATDPSSAYVVCMTCHRPHTLSTFSGNVQNSADGSIYATEAFVGAPYNPGIVTTTGEWRASSATQFCRQCHFTDANESSGIVSIHTKF